MTSGRRARAAPVRRTSRRRFPGWTDDRDLESLYDAAPYLILGADYLNTEFHVHAFTFGEKDRTRLAADTWVFSLGGGVTIPVGDRVHLGVGVQYVPLYVAQPPDPRSESDSMIQVRGEISYQLR